MLNKLERRIIDISYKLKLSHISSCLMAVGIIDKIYKVLIIGWIGSIIKILLFIVLPIVLSIIYLPPLWNQFLDFYKTTLIGIQGSSNNVSSLLEQINAIK